MRPATLSSITVRAWSSPLTVMPPEEDARAWSMSLFFRLRPQRFKRLALVGEILHVEPEPLRQFADEATGSEQGQTGMARNHVLVARLSAW